MYAVVRGGRVVAVVYTRCAAALIKRKNSQIVRLPRKESK